MMEHSKRGLFFGKVFGFAVKRISVDLGEFSRTDLVRDVGD